MFGLSTITNTVAAGLGAVAAAAITFGAMTTYTTLVTVPNARSEERALVLSEARERAMELINKRNDDNEEISKFDQAQLCVELGGKWNNAIGDCVEP
jgi:hypothetical protein